MLAPLSYTKTKPMYNSDTSTGAVSAVTVMVTMLCEFLPFNYHSLHICVANQTPGGDSQPQLSPLKQWPEASLAACHSVTSHEEGLADLLKHIAVNVIQPPQLLALGGHELAPVMCGLTIQTPPVPRNSNLSHILLSAPSPFAGQTKCKHYYWYIIEQQPARRKRGCSAINVHGVGAWFSTLNQDAAQVACTTKLLKNRLEQKGCVCVPIAFCCLEIVDKLATIGQELLGDAATQDTCASQTTLGLTCYVVEWDLANSRSGSCRHQSQRL